MRQVQHAVADEGVVLECEPQGIRAEAGRCDGSNVSQGPWTASDETLDHFVRRDGKVFAGTHLIIDLWGAERIDELDHVEKTLVEAVERSGATLLHIHLHHFTPNGGISGVAVLAESHISIHTWPERGYAALDVFMCGDAEPRKAIPVLQRAFNPDQVDVDEILRGEVEEAAEAEGTADEGDWFEETLYPDFGQRLRMDRILHRDRTEHQDLVIFENRTLGRVMALDGVVQTAEADEFVYHEMLTHVPILAHGRARRVLIIGGGDGGMLRRCLEHPSVERVTMVEIDRGVIDLCREHLPSISAGAFDDPRLDLVIGDGCRFVAETDDRFDVVIVDSTDPQGPGAVLFTSEFYAGCKRCLTPGGILVTQNGVPFFQPEELLDTWRRRAELFADSWFYVAPVPSYYGGFMAFGWATDDEGLRRQGVGAIAPRAAEAGLETRYYTPEIHVASFALPAHIRDVMR